MRRVEGRERMWPYVEALARRRVKNWKVNVSN